MSFLHFIFEPEAAWRSLAGEQPRWSTVVAWLLVLAAIPACAWYYGATRVGWQVGNGQLLRMTVDSARLIILFFYLAMVVGIGCIAAMIHWMAVTYGAATSALDAMRLTVVTATPMFLAGLAGFVPILWLDLIVGIGAASWSLYLLYVGIPVTMRISKERGYLFASATVAVCLVLLISLMGFTVALWEWGAMPVFTD